MTTIVKHPILCRALMVEHGKTHPTYRYRGDFATQQEAEKWVHARYLEVCRKHPGTTFTFSWEAHHRSMRNVVLFSGVLLKVAKDT